MKIFSTAILIFFVFYEPIYGQKWLPVRAGANGNIICFKEYNNSLYIGGPFSEVDSVAAIGIAKWNGSAWDSVGSGVCCWGAGWPNTLQVFNGELYAAGAFAEMGGVFKTINIARWNDIQWQTAGASSSDDASKIYAMASYKNELYAGGNITKLGGVNINRIARWDGNTWKDVGGGLIGGLIPSVYCMAVYKNELYVGGDFSIAGSTPVNFIARWDGVKWDSVAGGLNYLPNDMFVDTVEDVLWVCGGFDYADTVEVNGVAKWNGVNWSGLQNTPYYSGKLAINKYQNNIYIASDGGLTNDTFLLRWDGTQWNKVLGPNNSVYVLEVFNDDLYVGGAFDKVDTGGGSLKALTVNHIARLTMSEFSDTSTKDSIEKSIKIFPNPTKDSFFLEIQNISLSNTEAKIFDVTGKLVYQSPINSITTEISCGNWAKGIYFIKIFSDRIVIANEKIVIE